MTRMISRRAFIAAAGATSLAFAGGCSAPQPRSSAAGAASDSASGSDAAASLAITVGTLATEDILPLWVARQENLLADHGLDVELVEFQSATELIAGVISGDVDMAMTDIMVTASIFASGVDVRMEWVTLGTQPDQGRFGIMVGPDSAVQALDQLAGVPIGVGTNTILEYVMDNLMQQAGVPDDQIVVEEIQKLPVRYQAMLSGEVAAAALPGSLLALGEANGCRTVADDTTGENLSQSVMIARSDFAAQADGQAAIEELAKAWDEAVAEIDGNPQAYRQTLADNANLSDEIADTYAVSEYPACQLPTNEMVDPVLSWMDGKGYLSEPLSYNEETGEFSRE